MDTEYLLNKESVLLITGGAKGITAKCAISIAKLVQCKFILIGRSKLLANEPGWANASQTSEELQKNALAFFTKEEAKIAPKEIGSRVKEVLSSREITSTLERIRSFGGQATYCSVDVADSDAFSDQVRSAVQEMGEISGVIHGAGNLADKLIENKSESDFNLVVNSKVTGLASLVKVVDPSKLKFIVLFSSVAGFFGNGGQTDYAIANEILNKSAYILRTRLPKCQVIAIDWGPWDSGMVTPQLKKVFEQHQIPLINSEQGVETLISLLTNRQTKSPQVVTGSPIFLQSDIRINEDRPIRIHRTLSFKENPFAKDHRIGQRAVLPATCAAAWLADACEHSFPGWKFFRMEDFKVLKGITLEEGEQVYQLELKPVNPQDEKEKTFEALVTSQKGGERRLFHYSGKAFLVKTVPTPPNHQVIREILQNGLKPQQGSVLYENGTLFHGPAFQGIHEVSLMNENSVVTHLFLPALSTEDQGQFPVQSTNPFINDAVVQSLLIWSQEYHQAPCLPSRLHKMVQYRILPFNLAAWVLLQVTFHNEHVVVGDLLVLDDDGNEYFHLAGLEGTISAQLNRFIGKKSK